MSRIVAGVAGGCRLAVPAGTRVRPTSDRVREAVFSALESARGPWTGARVLDLYAGTGALGLEALSRGAARVEMVEHARPVLSVLRRNVATVGLPGAHVVAVRVEKYLRAPAAGPPDRAVDVVLADPPYPLPGRAVTEVLAALVRQSWLADDALVVVERATRGEPLRWPPGLVGTRDRRYGETTVWYGHRAHDPHRQGAT